MINRTIRIEDDKQITKLLKKHKKYRIEYNLNVDAQGYYSEVLAKFAPLVVNLAIASTTLEIMRKSLKEAKLI